MRDHRIFFNRYTFTGLQYRAAPSLQVKVSFNGTYRKETDIDTKLKRDCFFDSMNLSQLEPSRLISVTSDWS